MSSQGAPFGTLISKANDPLRFFGCVLTLTVGKGCAMSSGTTRKAQSFKQISKSNIKHKASLDSH